MRVVEKEVFVRQRDPKTHICPGAACYVRARENHLLFQYQEGTVGDIVDSQQEIISRDNGRTWSAPRTFRVRRPVEGGTECYNDLAAFLDPLTDKVCFIIGRYVERPGVSQRDIHLDLAIGEYDAVADTFRVVGGGDFGLQAGIFVSMSWAVSLTPDKVLVPAKTFVLDAEGRQIRYYPESGWAVQQDVMLIGERAGGAWAWRLGGKVPSLHIEVSSRGCHEHSVARLADGRLVTVIRGSNAKYVERPGFKWQSFSSDDGESWSRPEPVRYTDGTLMESGSNAPCLFRSRRTGSLYFIGNPCLPGERASANQPRHTLAMFKVQEAPFALRRETMAVIDRRGEREPPGVQLSNFRYYEDRADGALVLFMTRCGEKPERDGLSGDLYRYRIELD